MLHYIICIYTILSFESHAPVVFFPVEGGFLHTVSFEAAAWVDLTSRETLMVNKGNHPHLFLVSFFLQMDMYVYTVCIYIYFPHGYVCIYNIHMTTSIATSKGFPVRSAM